MTLGTLPQAQPALQHYGGTAPRLTVLPSPTLRNVLGSPHGMCPATCLLACVQPDTLAATALLDACARNGKMDMARRWERAGRVKCYGVCDGWWCRRGAAGGGKCEGSSVWLGWRVGRL